MFEEKLGSSYTDDGYVFHFKFPKEGLALSLVTVIDSLPEIQFVASPKVPTITEEDFATVCKLVYENKRPEFCFCAFPKDHPYVGRQYKSYRPPWLRGTSVGDLLFEADWKMKCLHIGTRSNDAKSAFFSWKHSSKLQGLATWTDFPKDAKPVGHSVVMSCDSVKVHREENSMEFLEEPVIRITDQANSLYSKYISEIFPNIAYHDEPLFLKIQELSKLILACEWLIKEKGVKFSQRWMFEHTTKQLDLSPPSTSIASCPEECKKPPYDMIPIPTTVCKPSDDVSVITRETEQYKCLTECGIKYYYGYCDGGELLLCTEDGKLVQQQHCMKMVCEQSTVIGGVKVRETKKWLNFPFPKLNTLELPMTNQEIQQEFDKYLVPESTRDVAGPLGPMTIHVETDKILTDDAIRLTTTKTAQPYSSSCSPVKETLIMTASVKDYDMLYGNYAPPNTPIQPNLVPNVESWSELHRESVPWPKVFQVPYTGVGEPTPSGGILTYNLTETEVPASISKTSLKKRSPSRFGQYAQYGNSISVQGMHGKSAATICKATKEEFTDVTRKFQEDWKKGTCPNIDFVFVVTNDDRKKKWADYRRKLSVKTSEIYYHGTTLGCTIATTKKLCQFGWCGVCGISSRGLDPSFIKQKIGFQRFGPGFYLAPHSSKCHDYTIGDHDTGYRAMLRCSVLPGKKYHLKKTDTHLQGPPGGYDSIYGEVGSGGDLNYPEIVVPKENVDAVIVEYIILYQKDGTKLNLK